MDKTLVYEELDPQPHRVEVQDPGQAALSKSLDTRVEGDVLDESIDRYQLEQAILQPICIDINIDSRLYRESLPEASVAASEPLPAPPCVTGMQERLRIIDEREPRPDLTRMSKKEYDELIQRRRRELGL